MRDLVELLCLSFQWLADLSRFKEGKHEIGKTRVLEMVSMIAKNWLPLIQGISQDLYQEMVDDLAKFLSALTDKTINVSQQYKLIK